MSLWDVQGSYTGFKHFTFTLGVKNVLDTNPPRTNQNLTFQAGYDPNVLRRTRALRVRKRPLRVQVRA